MNDLDDPTLLAGFLANDEALSAAYFDRLMPAVRARIKSRWKSLRHAHDELEDRCVATLVEWRRSGLLREGESLADLASRLVNQNVEAVQRLADNDERVAKATGALTADVSGDPEQEIVGAQLRQRVWQLQATLASKHQQVLEAQARAESEDKTVAEILGVSPDNSWKLAQRAREALAAAIRTAGLTASDFLEVDDG